MLQLLKTYLVDGAAFQAWPDMKGLPRDNTAYDYAHLERMAEWRNDAGDDDAEDAA